MKPKIKNILRFDYVSTMLFVLSAISTLLVVAIIAVQGEMLVVAILIFIATTGLLSYRVYAVSRKLKLYYENVVSADVYRVDNERGSVKVGLKYVYNDQEYSKRITIYTGPILKSKINKMTNTELIVSVTNPKDVYMKELFYK